MTLCHRLRLTQDHKAIFGRCDGQQTEVAYTANQNGGIDSMVAQFAPFEASVAPNQIAFNGQGKIVGADWERAITNWTQFTYAELASGHIGAANRTVMAWNLASSRGPQICATC